MRILGFFCIGIIFLFLFRELWSNWTALKGYSWKWNWPLGLISFAALTGSLFFLPWGLKEVLALLGHPLPYFRTCKILFASLMAKYLPGGWWAFVGRAHFYRREGLTLPQASVAVLMETLLVVTSGILVFSLFSLYPASLAGGGQKAFWVLLGGGCLALLHPFFLNLLLVLVEKIFKKPVMTLHFPYRRIGYPFFIFFLFWLGMGGSFWILAGSLIGLKLALLPQMVSAFALSWILGFLSFITPGGLGVREGALTLLLTPSLPLYAAAALSLLSRIWWIGGEVLGLVVSLLWERRSQDEPRPWVKKEGPEWEPLSPPGKNRNF